MLPLTLMLSRVSPFTLVALMPSLPVFTLAPPALRTFILVRLTDEALVRSTPDPVVFWIVPPEPRVIVPPPAFAVVLPRVVLAGSEAPSPVTVKLPAPVPLSTMPFVEPFAAILLKVTPLPPMVVLVILTAVPVVVAIVLFAPVTLTVPPPVAEKPLPETPVMVMLLKLKMPPVLLVRLTPLAAPVAPIVMLRTVVVPVVIAFPNIPEPADGLIVRYSTRVLVLSVTMVAALLSTGVVLAGNESAWLNGASVMPASLSAVVMLIA